MNNKKVGKRTVKLQHMPTIISAASIVGPKEGKGPLRDYFDKVLDDDLHGEKTWELAECKMMKDTIDLAVKKSDKGMKEIDYLIGGDLINQIWPFSFAARDLDIPFIGVY